MSEHTPGPWKEVRLVGGSHRVTTAAGCSIAEAFGAGATDAPNARLIAAAPDMLAALELAWDKILTEYCSSDSPVRQTVEEAIAKAKGDGE